MIPLHLEDDLKVLWKDLRNLLERVLVACTVGHMSRGGSDLTRWDSRLRWGWKEAPISSGQLRIPADPLQYSSKATLSG